MRPDKVEYSISTTVHNQPLKLICCYTGGREEWSLVQEPINQRDERCAVRGLTRDALKRIAEIVGGA